MKIISALLMLQILLFVSGGCGKPANTRSWEDDKVLLNELKDTVLEQEGRFNIFREENDKIVVKPREEDLQVELDMERVADLMDELDLYMVYVRPEEEYFAFKEPVELQIPYGSEELCYSGTVVPEYPWALGREWTDLGDGWYSWYFEQI